MALLHNELTRTMSQPTSDSNGSADTTTMNPDLTADSTSPIIPSCGTCKKPLEPSVDKHKTKYSFWRNCKTCRDKQTSAKRKANGLPPKEATTIKKRKDAVRPAQEQPREVHVNVDRSHDFATRSSLTGFDEIIEEHSAQTEIMQEVATAVTAKEEEGNVSYANDQESAIQDRECSVCAESFPVQDFPSLIACSHEANVCRTCFLAWIDQCMASTTWDQFSCPSSDCTSLISHSDVKIYAPTDVFTRFDELSMRSFLSNEPNFFYCPSETCTSGQIHDTSVAGYIFRCNACGFRICTHHESHVPFHDEETCTQFDERVARERAQEEQAERRRQEAEKAEQASLAEVEKSSVECPGCGANIAKNGGCDHMTCRRKGCAFEFCYVCRAPYLGDGGIHRVGNSAHAETCTYHSARLPRYEWAVLEHEV